MMTATIELRLYCDDRSFFFSRRDRDGSKAKDRPVLLDTIATHRDAADRMVVRRGLYFERRALRKIFRIWGQRHPYPLRTPAGELNILVPTYVGVGPGCLCL